MTNNLLLRRLLQLGGLFLLGDGVMGLIKPRRPSLLWRFGPELARAATEELGDYPKAARTIYLAEAALGVALITLPTPEVD